MECVSIPLSMAASAVFQAPSLSPHSLAHHFSFSLIIIKKCGRGGNGGGWSTNMLLSKNTPSLGEIFKEILSASL